LWLRDTFSERTRQEWRVSAGWQQGTLRHFRALMPSRRFHVGSRCFVKGHGSRWKHLSAVEPSTAKYVGCAREARRGPTGPTVYRAHSRSTRALMSNA
jgi:hypothetical protein